MSWTLVFAWAILSAFVYAQQSEIYGFKGASQGYLLALNLSALLGFLAGIALIVYAFFELSWYWPLVMITFGIFSAGAFVQVVRMLMPNFVVALLAFPGWPLSAAWVFYLLRSVA